MVSEKHCNFLINTGSATAADIEGLGRGGAPRRRRMRRDRRAALEWEIHRIGVPGAAKPEARMQHDPRRGPLRRHLRRTRGQPVDRPAGDRRAARSRLRRHADRGRRRSRRCHRRADARSPTPCSTRCTAASARTARSRACSTGWAFPYTHSGVRASALAMDKVAAKAVFAAAGLPVAHGRVVPMRRTGSRRPAAAALCGQAGQRRLVGRRRDHPQRRQPPRRGRPRLALRHAPRWSRNTSPAANSPSA